MIATNFVPQALQAGSVRPATPRRTVAPSLRRARRTRARLAPLVARTVAVLVTLALLAGLGALLIAEYALLWHTLVVPWLGNVAPVGR